MFRHERLDEDGALLRIEAGSDPIRGVLVGVRRQLGSVCEVARQRVPVGNKVEAVVLVLQRNPVAQGSYEMSEMKLTGGTHARHDAGLSSRRKSHTSHERIMRDGATTRYSKPRVNISA